MKHICLTCEKTYKNAFSLKRHNEFIHDIVYKIFIYPFNYKLKLSYISLYDDYDKLQHDINELINDFDKLDGIIDIKRANIKRAISRFISFMYLNEDRVQHHNIYVPKKERTAPYVYFQSNEWHEADNKAYNKKILVELILNVASFLPKVILGNMSRDLYRKNIRQWLTPLYISKPDFKSLLKEIHYLFWLHHGVVKPTYYKTKRPPRRKRL
jgi:hypothetical protein